MARDEVAAGEGVFRTRSGRAVWEIAKSSASVPSGPSACARTHSARGGRFVNLQSRGDRWGHGRPSNGAGRRRGASGRRASRTPRRCRFSLCFRRGRAAPRSARSSGRRRADRRPVPPAGRSSLHDERAGGPSHAHEPRDDGMHRGRECRAGILLGDLRGRAGVESGARRVPGDVGSADHHDWRRRDVLAQPVQEGDAVRSRDVGGNDQGVRPVGAQRADPGGRRRTAEDLKPAACEVAVQRAARRLALGDERDADAGAGRRRRLDGGPGGSPQRNQQAAAG
jgi:hypothetical protein